MTKLAVPPGLALPLAQRRMRLPSFGLPKPDTNGVNTAASTRPALSVIAAGSANTKGSWAEAVAATATDANAILVVLYSDTAANTQNTSTLLDIGIGAAGSEVVIVPNLGIGYAQANNWWLIPVRIPKGSRVAFRNQSAVASKNTPVTFTLLDLPHFKRAPGKVLNLNASTATSLGTSLATPGAINTKSSYVEITAATTQPLGALIICPQGAADTSFVDAECLVDLAVGAAGSEVVVPGAADLYFVIQSTGELIRRFQPLTIPCEIPAGARIAARWQCTSTSQLIDLTVLGVPAG